MTATKTTHYRCDRCSRDSINIGQYPQWLTLDINNMGTDESPWVQRLMGGIKHLCPRCSAVFLDFMDGKAVGWR